LDALETAIPQLLEAYAKGLYEKALANREKRMFIARDMQEMKALADSGDNGFISGMWCGARACEDKIKEDFGITSRCMPFDGEAVGDRCVCCGEAADKLVYWGRAY
jgi:prolyl-tRNA synthetase